MTAKTNDVPTVIHAAAGPLVIKHHPAARRNYGRERRVTKFIVIHCTDGHEGMRKDDDVAAMFAREDLTPRRSCHYVVDADSITLCVPTTHIAWHCGHIGNARGIGIELCGRARQTREQWLDAFSLPTLALAARLVVDLCHEFELPTRFLTADALRVGATGITTHAEVGLAWRQTRHTDPGPHFPLDLFMDAVRGADVGRKELVE